MEDSRTGAGRISSRAYCVLDSYRVTGSKAAETKSTSDSGRIRRPIDPIPSIATIQRAPAQTYTGAALPAKDPAAATSETTTTKPDQKNQA